LKTPTVTRIGSPRPLKTLTVTKIRGCYAGRGCLPGRAPAQRLLAKAPSSPIIADKCSSKTCSPDLD
jgi:hypothetical protein